MLAQPQVDAPDDEIGLGIHDAEDGPGPFLPRASRAIDVCPRFRLVGQLLVPTHPLPDVRLRVDLPDRRRIRVSAGPQKQLAVSKRRVRRYELAHYGAVICNDRIPLRSSQVRSPERTIFNMTAPQFRQRPTIPGA